MTGRGRDITVEVVEPKRAKPPKPTKETLAERIQKAADEFYSERSKDVEREITSLLEKAYDSLVLNLVGLERDHWHSGNWRWAHHVEGSQRFREAARGAAQRIMDSVDFSTVTLTPSQVTTIKNAYKEELQRHLTGAARDLAREDALVVASQVLGVDREQVQAQLFEEDTE